LNAAKVPTFSHWKYPGFPHIPPALQGMTELEFHFVCPRIPFMNILALPSGFQLGLSGMVVNVPADVSRVQTLLPRAFNPHETIAFRLKRKLEYAGHYKKANICPKRVVCALEYLVTLDLWKEAGVTVNVFWSIEHPISTFCYGSCSFER
jgi:hypothetical protein